MYETLFSYIVKLYINFILNLHEKIRSMKDNLVFLNITAIIIYFFQL